MRLLALLPLPLAACTQSECYSDHVRVSAVDATGATLVISSLTWSVDGGAEERVDCDNAEGACDEVLVFVPGDGHYTFSVEADGLVGAAELDVTGAGQHAAEESGCAEVYSEEVVVTVE